ncbi:hypothetical protein SDIAM103S_05937 [Streptomyces diastaticus subsp. diastaticus]
MAVTCRVLGLTRQPYNRWLVSPVTDAELTEAHRANALFEAHRDGPEFGHRFLVDEAPAAAQVMAERAGWRICRDNRWWSVFGKRKGRGKNAKAGPPVHDDRVRRNFTAPATNRLWLTDITEHAAGEGKLYLCAVKDVYSGRIVGYSIDSRMKSSLTVSALESAVARRGQVAGCIVHSDRGSPFRARKYVAVLARHSLVGSMDRVGRQATTRPWRASSRCCRRTSSTAGAGPTTRSCGSRSWPGSNAPTTVGAGKDVWPD